MDRNEHDETFRSPEMDRVNGLLDELNHGDPPPPNLVREVMASVRAGRTRGTYGGKDTFMAKKALIGLSAAAAAFIAVFTMTGWPLVDKGTEGAIGAAKRHQAQQLTASDVKLGDASIQDVLQSDVVARIMKDP